MTNIYYNRQYLDKSDFKEVSNALKNRLITTGPYVKKFEDKIKKLSDIGRALSGEPEINQLLKMIVYEARSFTNADAGTLYLLEGNHLKFKIIQK